MIDPWALSFAVMAASCSFLVAAYSLHLAIQTRIECRAMKESTHNVQFVPLVPNAKDFVDESADAANTIGEHEDYERLSDIHQRDEPLN